MCKRRGGVGDLIRRNKASGYQWIESIDSFLDDWFCLQTASCQKRNIALETSEFTKALLQFLRISSERFAKFKDRCIHPQAWSIVSNAWSLFPPRVCMAESRWVRIVRYLSVSSWGAVSSEGLRKIPSNVALVWSKNWSLTATKRSDSKAD